jgi:carboxyl-terminal processing protease
MLRRTTPILTLLILALFGLGEGQVTDSTRAGGGAQGSTPPTESQVFLGAFQNILTYHQTTFNDSTLWEQALEGLIEGLNDPYATVFTPEEYGEFEEDNTGDYAGIGVQITQLNDRVTVTAVFRRTPADEVGMVVGDQIVEVEGVDARGWTTDMARDSIRGPIGSVVEVKVQREGLSEPLAFPIRRNQVHVSAVTGSMVRDSIGYILVDQVARGSATEVDSVFGELEAAKGIILDLRRNPGGFLVESLSMADLFLDRGKTLASTVSRSPGQPNKTTQESWSARLPARIPDKTIVVLVDRFTASAAEIVAGALQDHDRAVVIGERTFGKGVVQTVLPLPGDRRLRITTGKWMTPLGRSLHIPRDMQGRPLQDTEAEAEGAEDFATVVTPAGRSLRADGGVFPDLVIEDDTLTTPEQTLLIEAGRAQIPLLLKITEFAFDHAKRSQAGTGPEELAPEAIESFIQGLEDDGLPPEVLENDGARRYLDWQLRLTFARRAEHLDHALEFQAERDRVLAAALKLLEESGSQSDLFAAVEAQAALAHRALEVGAPSGNRN